MAVEPQNDAEQGPVAATTGPIDAAGGGAPAAGPVVTPPGGQQFVCKICGQSFDRSVILAQHVRKAHKGQKDLEKKQQTEEEVIANIRINGPVVIEGLIRDRLNELLNSPQVPTNAKEYALSEWDNDASIHFDMGALARMLTQDAGVKPEKALRIVEQCDRVFQQYATALQGQQINYVPMGSRLPQQPNIYGYPSGPNPYAMGGPVDAWGRPVYGQPGSQYYGLNPYQRDQGYGGQPPMGAYGGPGYGPRPETLTAADVARIVEEKLARAPQRQAEPVAQQGEQTAEIDLPMGVDQEGKTIFSHAKVPISTLGWLMMSSGRQSAPAVAPSNGDSSQEVMEMLHERFVKPMEERTKSLEDQLRTAKEQANADQIRRVEEQLKENREQMAGDRKYIQDLNDKFIAEVKNRPSSAEGYNNDSFKVLATGIEKVSKLIEERKPVELIVKNLLAPVPAAAVPAQGTSEELARLAAEGLVDDK